MLPSPRGRDHPFRGWNRTLRGRDEKIRGFFAPKRGRAAPFLGKVRSPWGKIPSPRGMGRSPRGRVQRTQPGSTPMSSPGRGEPVEFHLLGTEARPGLGLAVACRGLENRILHLGDSSTGLLAVGRGSLVRVSRDLRGFVPEVPGVSGVVFTARTWPRRSPRPRGTPRR